ncbi:MAG: helix-turn-helix transcriptional regulator [Clostridia bacterium]|nr:helix-turn-helix transcriptional regulator [Clostridia bacterium]
MLPNLKLLRKEFGISQQRLADAIGVSQPSINKYENHNIEPEIEILKRLADYFNTSIDYIVGHTDVKRKMERTEDYSLNEGEASLITKYRALRVNEKQCIEMTVNTFLDR